MDEHDKEERKKLREAVEAMTTATKNLANASKTWKNNHSILYRVGVSVLGLAVLGVAGVIGHNKIDASYEDNYTEALRDIANRSALSCGLDDADKQTALFRHVSGDLRSAARGSLLRRVLPFSDILPRFDILPTRRAFKTLEAANNHELVLFPAGSMLNGMGDGIQAVIYNEGGETAPVMNYDSLNDNQLENMLEYASNNSGSFPEGALVLVWNDSLDDYESLHISTDNINPDGETTFGMSGTFNQSQILPENECGVERGFASWIPFTGSDDDDQAETAEEEAAPVDTGDEKPGGFSRAWNWATDLIPGGDDEPAAEELQQAPQAPAPE